MAENILELLFKINADPKEAEAALAHLKASTVAESTEISNIWGQAMNAITGPVGIALGAVVGLGGGMIELANKAAEAGSKIFEASETTGIAADKLSGLSAISKQTGESFDGLTMGLARAGRNLQMAIIEPGAITSQVLAQVMGGTQQLAELGLKPMGERLQIVLEKIFKLNDVGERNLALSTLFGRSWMTNIETLKVLAEQGYGPAIEKAKEFGLYFDEDSARKAKEFTVEMHNLEGELSGIALRLGRAVLPAFESFISTLLNTGLAVKGLMADVHVLLSELGGPTGMAGAVAADSVAWDNYRASIAAFHKEISDLVEGQNGLRDGTVGLTKAVHAHSEALADLLEKEKVENDALQAGDSKRRTLILSYENEQRAITKALAAERREGRLTAQMEAEAQAARVEATKNFLLKIAALDEQEHAATDKRNNETIQKMLALYREEDNFFDEIAKSTGKLNAEQQKQALEGVNKGWEDQKHILDEVKPVIAQIHQLYGNVSIQMLQMHPQMIQQAKDWKAVQEGGIASTGALKNAIAEFGLAKTAAAQFQSVAVQAFDQFATAAGRAAAASMIYGGSIASSLEQAMKAALASLAGQAIGQAIFCLAQGLWYLAEGVALGDPRKIAAAELDFEAAAIFGAIGVGAAAVGSAIPGGKSSGSARGAGGGRGAGAGSGGDGGGGGASGFPDQGGVIQDRPASGTASAGGNMHITIIAAPDQAKYVHGLLMTGSQRQAYQQPTGQRQAYPSVGGR